MDTSRSAGGRDLLLDLHREEGTLQRRLTAALRSAVHEGRAADGEVLPPSRTLAQQLGVSRWAVVEAYTQLTAEGYLVPRPGSGTVVRAVHHGRPAVGVRSPEPRPPVHVLDLAPGVPDLRAFPRSRWAEAHRLALADRDHADLGHQPGTSWPPAAATVASYLRRTRAVRTDQADVSLTRGSTATSRELGRALVAHGYRSVAVEDPSWPGLRTAFADAGLCLVPIPVDHQGLRVDQLSRHPDVQVALVTPAHQFPVGVALSAARRRELVAWAAAIDGLVIEDDYDAEFRYDHRPIAALQGMAPDRVVLLGSVSKTLAPSLELGWTVLPDRWRHRLELSITAPPLLTQGTLSTMIDRGWYDRQLVTVRQRYRRRRQRLLDALAARLPDAAPSGMAAGLHLVLALPAGADEQAVAAGAAERGLRVVPTGRYWMDVARPIAEPSLTLGYGNLRDNAEDEAVWLLHQAITDPGARTRLGGQTAAAARPMSDGTRARGRSLRGR